MAIAQTLLLQPLKTSSLSHVSPVTRNINPTTSEIFWRKKNIPVHYFPIAGPSRAVDLSRCAVVFLLRVELKVLWSGGVASRSVAAEVPLLSRDARRPSTVRVRICDAKEGEIKPLYASSMVYSLNCCDGPSSEPCTDESQIGESHFFLNACCGKRTSKYTLE